MAGAEMESAAGRVPEEWEALVAEEADIVGLEEESRWWGSRWWRKGAGGREKGN